jgi:methylated-DNA-[protein]-cysteine S-methyltransferase
MTATGFALFSTAIGACGIAWGEGGIVGLRLPDSSESVSRARLAKRFPDAREMVPPPDMKSAIEAIVALLRGEAADLSAVRLDMERVPPFDRGVYEVARTIPPGATLTYGEIAARLGDKSTAQEVGKALGRNPFPIVVPCHRVLAAGGKIGGFSARGGIGTKRKLLAIESAHAKGAPTLFDVGSRPTA